MSRHRYDMIAVDLDGTLLDSRGRVSERNVRAIAAAREAGITVTACTGRGLVECAGALEAIAQTGPVVVAGGSILACPSTKRTLHRFALEHDFVRSACERMLAHRHAVLVLKDPVAAGYDYLVVHGEERHPLDPVTEWWFEKMGCGVRYAATPDEDEHPEHTVRMGACGLSSALARMTEDLIGSFGDRAVMHHFPCVVAPEHASRLPDGERFHILEVFSREANKWSAIRWLADREGTSAERIAAIGDEINDLPMIRGAGLGIAMGNAVPSVRDAAKRRTLSNDEDGVAHAIERILDGAW